MRESNSVLINSESGKCVRLLMSQLTLTPVIHIQPMQPRTTNIKEIKKAAISSKIPVMEHLVMGHSVLYGNRLFPHSFFVCLY